MKELHFVSKLTLKSSCDYFNGDFMNILRFELVDVPSHNSFMKEGLFCHDFTVLFYEVVNIYTYDCLQ